MTLSLAAVFIPVLFMGGVLGRLFKEFAVTICVAILISGVVSVTLTPMLCSRFLRSVHDQQARLVLQRHRALLRRMLRVYDMTLQWALRHRCMTMGVSGVVLAATMYMFVTIPKGFIPDQDTDQMQVYTEAAQGTSYYQMVEYEQEDRGHGGAGPERGFADGQRRRHDGVDSRRPELRRTGGPPQAAKPAQNERRRDHQGPASEACRSLPGCRSTCRIRRRSGLAAR